MDDDPTGATNDRVVVKATDADTISWGTQSTLLLNGGTGVDVVGLSATAVVPTDAEIAAVFIDATVAGGELEFSTTTVPENILFLLTALPFLPIWLTKLRKKKGCKYDSAS